MSSTPLVQVILGSTRQGRAGERVARWFVEQGAGREDLQLELVDLRDWPLPFFDSPVPPMMGNYQDPAQQAWAAQVARADAYVLITPEYNHGYPAVLKNALDTLYAEWRGKPVGFVGYGGPGGGIRAVEQLRQASWSWTCTRCGTRSSCHACTQPSTTTGSCGSPGTRAKRLRSWTVSRRWPAAYAVRVCRHDDP